MKSLVGKFLAIVALVAVGAFSALWAMNAFFSFSPFGAASESRDTQVINSITREEQVVLLSLGIQGISEKSEISTLFGTKFPGSERTKFIQYAFNAKLGIEGKDVRIEQTGENAYLVCIPEFIFIGHTNEDFRLVAENNGLLSLGTPEIDSIEMVNEILDQDAQKLYVDNNEEILRDQASAFYSGIITSVDPVVVVEFEFRD